jgi:dTDP-4-dehydrorhamnose reductase
VIVTGASGQLGAALVAKLADSCVVDGWSRGDVDITQWSSVRDRTASTRPNLVIHAAAATNVDRCETEPGWAWAVNALGTRHVSQASAAVGAELVYISTNYVFDGLKAEPYHEYDSPQPISVYGASKLAGEGEARAATPHCHVVRTAWLYSSEGHNFVNTMRRLLSEREELAVVSDQVGNPTSADDLANAVLDIVDRAPYGTYHAVNDGIASWHDWATCIAEIIGSRTKIKPIPGATYQRAATPPENGALCSLALPGLGIELPEWRDALRRTLVP